jgi:uncharacterized protein (TIGR03435 family)
LLINPNGLLTVRNRSLRGLVAFAYGLQSAEVIEVGAGARELADTRYDITAKIRAVDADTVFDEQQLKALARRILAEQFRLTFHWDEQRVPVYELTADTTGEQTTKGMRIASDEDPGPLLNLGFNSLTGHAVPMKLLTQYLASRFKQPIVDRTGLKASYNFKLTWGSELLAVTQPADLPLAPEPSIDVLAQALESQLGLRITQEVGNVRRMIVDNLDQAVNLTPTPTEVPMLPKVFDRYVGHYEFPPGRVMTIFRSGEQFFAQPTGQNAVLLTALGETEFYAKAVGAKLKFFTRDGSVTELVLSQNGSEHRMSPLAAAVANERLAKLAERIREKRALPSSEQLLRVYFASLSADRPAYHLMTEPVAAAVRRDWPTAKARFAKIGAIKAIEFTGVSSVGADIYRVSFEHSTSEWRIGLNDVGQIDVLNYRRLPM